MAAVTIRKLPERTRLALKLRAARSGRSTEAEIRAILEAAIASEVRIGSALLALGRSIGGVRLSLKRDRSPVETARFE